MNKKQDKLVEKRHVEGNRYMKIRVDYNKGSGRRPRGFYLSISPVVDGGDYEISVLDFGGMSGYCCHLLVETQRFNQKLLDSLTPDPAIVNEKIAAMMPTVKWADSF